MFNARHPPTGPGKLHFQLMVYGAAPLNVLRHFLSTFVKRTPHRALNAASAAGNDPVRLAAVLK